MSDFAKSLGVHPLTARILMNRGMSTLAEAQVFLDAPLTALHDPLLLPDMEIAVARICRAIQNREPITVYGDYDTDGVCATALMQRFFRSIGVAITPMLPHRIRDGYGLSVAAVEKIAATAGSLLITVDNGTTALEAVCRAKALGLDVIITDHHQCQGELPPALACVNPNRPDSHYPFKELCGTAVAFKLLIALRRALRDAGFFKIPPPNLLQLLPYVAIATIADIMPLTGENRILVKQGLQMLTSHPGAGLAALLRLSAVDPAALDAGDIAFRIAPRLNAAGRMSEPDIALHCLASEDAVIATAAAEELDRLNTERQAAEQKILRTLESPDQVAALNAAAGIAIGDATYPMGIVGIIAGRLARSHRKPAVVVSFETGIGKGSVRSVPGLDLTPILQDCAAHLVAFGGHAQAAGVTVTPENWAAFQIAFAQSVARRITSIPIFKPAVDAVVDATDLTPDLCRDLKRLAPFGEGNPEPMIAVRPMTVHSRRQVGVNHLKMRFGNQLVTIDAIGFGLWDHPASQGPLDMVVGVPELKTWKGETRLQLRILDLNPKVDKPGSQ